jgi:phosphatidylinositol 4-phosphatase
MLGRKHLEEALARQGLLGPPPATLAATFPDFDSVFKNMWADHGDDVSRQYAGTGALKSGFTRTGKRDVWGLLDDGAKSAARYYLNNFHDGQKQDALDYASGAFQVNTSERVLPPAMEGFRV